MDQVLRRWDRRIGEWKPRSGGTTGICLVDGHAFPYGEVRHEPRYCIVGTGADYETAPRDSQGRLLQQNRCDLCHRTEVWVFGEPGPLIEGLDEPRPGRLLWHPRVWGPPTALYRGRYVNLGWLQFCSRECATRWQVRRGAYV